MFTLVGLSAWLDDPRFVLALPILINGALLLQFGLSLRTTPMVERFARMQDPNLGPAQVAYCRSVTKVWCVFFVVNACVSAYLALFAEVASWALYTGLIAYMLMGVLGATEYLVRKARFREYGTGLHDRLIARVFPPHDAAGVAMRLPLSAHRADDVVCFGGQGARTRAQLLNYVDAIAARLPAAPAGARVVLACVDRYHFAASLLAVWQRGLTAALPPNGQIETVRGLRAMAGVVELLHDQDEDEGLDVRTVEANRGEEVAREGAYAVALAPSQAALIVYTSAARDSPRRT